MAVNLRNEAIVSGGPKRETRVSRHLGSAANVVEIFELLLGPRVELTTPPGIMHVREGT